MLCLLNHGTGLEKVHKPFCYGSTIGTLFSRKQDTGLHVVCTDTMRGAFNTLIAKHMLFDMKVCIRLLRHKEGNTSSSVRSEYGSW